MKLVQSALARWPDYARLEQAVDKLDQAPDPEEERPPFLDPMVMEEILSELRDIAVWQCCWHADWMWPMHAERQG